MTVELKNEIGVLFVVSNPNSIETVSKDFLAEGIIAVATDNEYDTQQYIIGGENKIVLLDVTLADNERNNKGLSILKWIKWNEKTKNVPVVMFTDNIDEKIKREAKELGILDFMISPKSIPRQIANQLKEIVGKL